MKEEKITQLVDNLIYDENVSELLYTTAWTENWKDNSFFGMKRELIFVTIHSRFFKIIERHERPSEYHWKHIHDKTDFLKWEKSRTLKTITLQEVVSNLEIYKEIELMKKLIKKYSTPA